MQKRHKFHEEETWRTLWKTVSYWAEEYVMSQLCRSSCAEVTKFLAAHVILFNVFIFSNISFGCTKEYLIAATYCCHIEVKVRDRIAAVISEIIVSSGRHFTCVFYCDISRQYDGCSTTAAVMTCDERRYCNCRAKWLQSSLLKFQVRSGGWLVFNGTFSIKKLYRAMQEVVKRY